MDEKRLTTYIDSLSWQLPLELKELEKEALREEVPIIRRSTQSLLSFLVRLQKPEHILEIGTAVGFSGLLMLSNAPEETSLDTIEKVPARIQKAKESFKKFDVEPTNLDRVVGKTGEVIKKIDSNQYGEVKIFGNIWTAVSDEVIDVGCAVKVLSIDGVKLVVEKKED